MIIYVNDHQTLIPKRVSPDNIHPLKSDIFDVILIFDVIFIFDVKAVVL